MKKVLINSPAHQYIASEELRNAVNVAIALSKPLLIKVNPVRVRLCWLRA